jgi:hypothetical protein
MIMVIFFIATTTITMIVIIKITTRITDCLFLVISTTNQLGTMLDVHEVA